MGGDFLEGLRFAWRTPAVRGILIISLAYFAFGMASMQVFAPLFAKQVLDIGCRVSALIGHFGTEGSER